MNPEYYPLTVVATYPERSSRGLALAAILFFLKGFLLLPHLFVMYFLMIAMMVTGFLGQLIVLITGSYPEPLWNFNLGVLRWAVRMNAWLYGITDEYPPFRLSAGSYPVDVLGERPASSSRLLALLTLLFFVGKAILAVPHLIALWLLGLAQGIVTFLGYWAVLFLGQYPQPLWDFLVGATRWSTRVSAWLMGLIDQYPPFRLEH
jgi:hypothetical protein